MITAQIAQKAYLAIILLVAALMFPINIRAASGNVQICQPGVSCKIGEFLYNDSYAPITNATCTITSRYPDGTSFLASVAMTSAPELDGWYSHTFTAPTTIGLYRTEVKCTTGTETLALDKSFEVQTASVTSVPTANDVASSVWGYSGRSLSTFGNLVTDIWGSATRTLTGASLTTGSIATKSDVETDVKNVKTVTEETRLLIEKEVNKPIIKNTLESESSQNLQSKIDQTKSTADKLHTEAVFMKSKSTLITTKWNSYPESNLTISIESLTSVLDTTFTQINWLKENWNFSSTASIYNQANTIKKSLAGLDKEVTAHGKSNLAAKQIKSLTTQLGTLNKLIGSQKDAATSKTLFGNINQTEKYLTQLNSYSTQIDGFLSDWQTHKSRGDSYKEIGLLSKDVLALNKITTLNSSLVSKIAKNETDKNLKNRALGLKGVIGVNKLLLTQKPGKSIINTWLEEGSIVFKTLITNPSSLVSQDVPVKYYLPIEVRKEKITKVDDSLTIEYDIDKDQYFVSGEFHLKPNETKTVSVTVDDSVFVISEEALVSLRNQAEQLSRPLNNTSYFAQGVTLKSDIDASLDRVVMLQKGGVTPEDKIRVYREAQIELKSATDKIAKLKELTTAAGSIGTLFGFVGGAQAIAVWGLIIIMVAGFVFLAVYMRTIRLKESFMTVRDRQPLSLMEDEFVRDSDQKKNIPNLSPKRKLLGEPHKIVIVFIVTSLIGGSSFYGIRAANTARTEQINKQKIETNQATTQKNTESVLGTEDENKDSYIDINIFVPTDNKVAIMSEPTINSPVLTSLGASKKAKEIKRQDSWVNVVLQDDEGRDVNGWVDQDFIEEIKKQQSLDLDLNQKPQGAVQISQKMITINETLTGFLRVRKTPGGEEITKVSPGEEYLSSSEQNGWIKIVLEDGTNGWVSKQYVSGF